ncbi:putative bifunctional diguanylate cyclase/phosphodiesterase [Allosphingosinicella deserti]|uniref:Bifunctional diguanylate cyclase/phosphodiesterase n=1 Tax=Allosphingosinicella deserti TaxID=2116704 RepID=A0A2P7QRC6_9SPHN|nr:EAL domain-containing protein [Sphingomonas deserti]PSJ40499.1 bifunctional diguanylate cyclase/phosphodiesterase [Sphingomonas deserti]
MGLRRAGLGARFFVQVILPVAALALAIAVFAYLGVRTSALRSDEESISRQAREVRLAISATLDELAQSQTGVAIWDPVVLELRKPRPDRGWIDQNVGTWLNYVFDHDADFILGPDDAPVYAMIDGVGADPGRYRRLADAIAPFVEAVRGRSGGKANPHERLPGQALPAGSSVRTSTSTFHATDLASLDGRAAAVSVMRIIPDSPAVPYAPGREPLLVSIRYLDADLMQELSQIRLIAKARVTKAAAAPGSDLSMPLVSSRGVPLGYFTWQPELPGSKVLRSTTPVAIAAFTSVLALLGLLVFGIARLMRKDMRSLELLQAAHVELKAKEAQAHHLAYHDALTGLPNRAMFHNEVDQALAHQRAESACAVMLLDLDRFKQVNDTLGHLGGDLLIQAVATRIQNCLGEGDVVARLGGDEFAVLIASHHSDETTATTADSILAALRLPFEILGTQVYIGVSIGIAVHPHSAEDRSDLLRKADIAMYRAKEEGRDAYRFFTGSMDESIIVRRAIEQDLRIALDTGEGLSVCYQPQMDGSGTIVTGLEALIRWHHAVRGELTPEAFIPIAEEAGLIDQLGKWVLEQACGVARLWPDLSIAVNVSPLQFRTHGCAEALEAIVRAAGVEPGQIELEITEGILLDEDEVVRDALARLRRIGFRIALDDFGTGYSSLSYLRKFEVDKIKIDRSFVKRLGHDNEAAAIIHAVVTLGHAMALSVTAEGVETEEQGQMLRLAGCNELQGFLFSEAVPQAAIQQLVDRKRTSLAA